MPELIRAYHSYAPEPQLDRLALLAQHTGGWFSPQPLGCIYYFRERAVAWALLIDQGLERRKSLDYLD